MKFGQRVKNKLSKICKKYNNLVIDSCIMVTIGFVLFAIALPDMEDKSFVALSVAIFYAVFILVWLLLSVVFSMLSRK